MVSFQDLIRDKDNGNWIKALLAATTAATGFSGFISDVGEKFQKHLLGVTNQKTCTQCTTVQTAERCPNNVCNQFLKEIRNNHRYYDPTRKKDTSLSYRNTDITKWSTDYWEVLKCYFPASGYKDKTGCSDTDLLGILSPIINCTFFQKHISDNLSNKDANGDLDNLFTRIRERLNPIRHKANLKVDDSDLNDLIDVLKDALSDGKELGNNDLAKNAIRELEKLKGDTIRVMCAADVERVKQEATAILREDLQHQRDDNDNLKATIESLKSVIEALESTIKAKRVTEGRFADDLAEFYKERFRFLPLSPMLDEKDTQLTSVYVAPELTDKKTNKRMEKIRDLFYDREHECKPNKAIYVTADAGTGKTAFSRYLTVLWTALHKDDREALDQIRENNSFKDFLSDMDQLKEFRFVFLVQLRDLNRSLKWVDDMIHDCIVSFLEGHRDYTHEFVDSLLQGYKTLIILDGLDEWANVGKPERRVRRLCTILTTSRPYRLTDARIRHSEQDISISLVGIDPLSQKTLIKYATSCLNKENKKSKHHKDFLQELKSIHEGNVLHIDALRTPVIILQLLCLWHDDINPGASICAIYASMIDMLFGRAVDKHTINPEICSSPWQLPSCMSGAFAKQFSPYIIGLGEMAFNTLFDQKLTFTEDDLNPYKKVDPDVSIALKTGLLTRSLSDKVSSRVLNYTFVHKSYQEMLCAVYMATRAPDPSDFSWMDTLRRYASNGHTLLEISQVFLFLCGMNLHIASLVNNVFDREEMCLHVERCLNRVNCQGCSYQRCIANGLNEAKLNGSDGDTDFAIRYIKEHNEDNDLQNAIELINSGRNYLRTLTILGSACMAISERDYFSDHYWDECYIALPDDGVYGWYGGNGGNNGELNKPLLDNIPLLPRLCSIELHSIRLSTCTLGNLVTSLFSSCHPIICCSLTDCMLEQQGDGNHFQGFNCTPQSGPSELMIEPRHCYIDIVRTKIAPELLRWIFSRIAYFKYEVKGNILIWVSESIDVALETIKHVRNSIEENTQNSCISFHIKLEQLTMVPLQRVISAILNQADNPGHRLQLDLHECSLQLNGYESDDLLKQDQCPRHDLDITLVTMEVSLQRLIPFILNQVSPCIRILRLHLQKCSLQWDINELDDIIIINQECDLTIDMANMEIQSAIVQFLTLLMSRSPRYIVVNLDDCMITSSDHDFLSSSTWFHMSGRENEAFVVNYQCCLRLCSVTLSSAFFGWMLHCLGRFKHSVKCVVYSCSITQADDSMSMPPIYLLASHHDTVTTKLQLYMKDITMTSKLFKWIVDILVHTHHNSSWSMNKRFIEEDENEVPCAPVISPDNLITLKNSTVKRAHLRFFNVEIPVHLYRLMFRSLILSPNMIVECMFHDTDLTCDKKMCGTKGTMDSSSDPTSVGECENPCRIDTTSGLTAVGDCDNADTTDASRGPTADGDYENADTTDSRRCLGISETTKFFMSYVRMPTSLLRWTLNNLSLCPRPAVCRVYTDCKLTSDGDLLLLAEEMKQAFSVHKQLDRTNILRLDDEFGIFDDRDYYNFVKDN